jgi:hypothetical protein
MQGFALSRPGLRELLCSAKQRWVHLAKLVI